MNTKAVIFDMDGVLIDSEPSWGQAMLEVMREVGIPYTVDDVARYQGGKGRRYCQRRMGCQSCSGVQRRN